MRAVPFAAVYLIDAQVPTYSGADRYKTTGGVAAQTCVQCLQSLVDPGGGTYACVVDVKLGAAPCRTKLKSEKGGSTGSLGAVAELGYCVFDEEDGKGEEGWMWM